MIPNHCHHLPLLTPTPTVHIDPLQSPDALHVIPSLDAHVKLVEPPDTIVSGFALKINIIPGFAAVPLLYNRAIKKNPV